MAIAQFKVIQGHLLRYRSKVCMCDLLSVNNTNLHPILHTVSNIDYRGELVKFSLSTGVPLFNALIFTDIEDC